MKKVMVMMMIMIMTEIDLLSWPN